MIVIRQSIAHFGAVDARRSPPIDFVPLPEAKKPGTATLSVHGGEPRRKAYSAVTVPVALTATYAFSDSAEIRDHFDGHIEREEYGRYGNPTVRVAEAKLASLDGAEDAALFASGMAAMSTTLLALLKQGQHVVLTADCYRRTRQLATTILSHYGITADLVDAADEAAVERAIIPGKTRVLLSESPTNPYLRVCDMASLARLRDRHRGIKLVIDSTFATPVNQRPLEQGADLVIHSGTKYLGGHNDLLAGSVSGAAALVSAIRDLRGVLGPILDPHSAYLLASRHEDPRPSGPTAERDRARAGSLALVTPADRASLLSRARLAPRPRPRGAADERASGVS